MTSCSFAAGLALVGFAVVGASASGAARAQPAPGTAARSAAGASQPSAVLDAGAAAVGEPPARREPDVQHNVFEDGGSKIDELRVRGEVQHVVVTPKLGLTRSYEIIVPRGGRTPPDSTGGAMSAVGKRVWNVLAF